MRTYTERRSTKKIKMILSKETKNLGALKITGPIQGMGKGATPKTQRYAELIHVNIFICFLKTTEEQHAIVHYFSDD